jgi:hypothetical protein
MSPRIATVLEIVDELERRGAVKPVVKASIMFLIENKSLI